MESKHLWLIGVTGVGKTSIGRRIARRSIVPFFDTDAEVARMTHRSVADFWEDHGEEAFRRLEVEAVRAAGHLRDPSVIAPGGGAILDPGSRELMRQTGTVVWLQADLDWLAERLADKKRRPVLDGDLRTRLSTLMAERVGWYKGVADVAVDVTARTKDECVELVAEHWRRADPH